MNDIIKIKKGVVREDIEETKKRIEEMERSKSEIEAKIIMWRGYLLCLRRLENRYWEG